MMFIDTTMTYSYPMCFQWDPEPVPDDDRHNPKAWARWFREFLEELLGIPVYIPQSLRRRSPQVYILARRSLPLREWKMKTWKQEFTP